MMLAPVGKTASPGFPSSGSVSDATMDSRAGGRSGRPVALAILFNYFFCCAESFVLCSTKALVQTLLADWSVLKLVWSVCG